MPTRHIRKLKENEKVRDQVNRICSALAIIMPLTALPQIVLLYSSHNATGISLFTWVLGCIGVLPFIFYGIIHNLRQLVVLNSMWFMINCIMVTGIMMYS